MGIYLDFNSSTPLDERVLEYMIYIYKNIVGNADSRTHEYGDNARKIVEEARTQVASILSVKKEEVFFTSGATESNNIAIQGLREYATVSGKKHIITSAIEHKAVLETAKALQKEGYDVDFVRPDRTGRIQADQIIRLLREDTLLVSLMHVNNETGIIQPVKELGDILDKREVLFHVDATQSFGKLVEELKQLKYNMLSLSSHKIGGPQGIGALILRRKRYKLPPVKGIMYGGQQEHGIRPGTIPVALVAGLGKACSIAELEYQTNYRKCMVIKKEVMQLLGESGISYEINGEPEFCVPGTLNICFPGVASEALMLSTKQYCGVSNGSACNSNSYKPSFVLEAMNIPTDKIESSIRISWGPQTQVDELAKLFGKMIKSAQKLAF